MNNLCWSEVALHKQIGLSSANTNLSSKFSFFFFPHLLQKKVLWEWECVFLHLMLLKYVRSRCASYFYDWCVLSLHLCLSMSIPHHSNVVRCQVSKARLSVRLIIKQINTIWTSCLWPLSADGLSATHFHGNSFSFQHQLYSVISPTMNAVKNIPDEIFSNLKLSGRFKNLRASRGVNHSTF